MTAIAAVDRALWDIRGKSLNTPVYNLLGGKSRTGVLVYGHANGRDTEETADEVGKYKDMGYLALRAQSGVPGLPSTYGDAKDKLFYEPAEKGLPAGEAAGLGVDYNEKLAESFPYERAYLPVNRKLDGTMFNW